MPGRQLPERERQKVLRSYMVEGRIVAIPVRRSERLVLFDQVARTFEPGVRYSEAELNSALLHFSSDLVVLRQGLLDEGFMECDRRAYWRCGGTVDL